MAYQVLARKYRPQRFSDVIGQDHVTRTLLNALTQGRVAHGYIFSGHRGIGKTTIARILAMALNCEESVSSPEQPNPARPTPEPCGLCVNCREISAASRTEVDAFAESHSFDVEEIDAATRRGIDDAKLLTSKIQGRPIKSKYKILILDEAHQITDAAWNALLKTLEEPPEWAIFMFATTQPEDIPQTVRSRCQHFSFHAVKLDDILKQLRMIVEKEDLVADDAALNLLAEAGDGSVRDALSIMDQAIASAPVKDGRAVLEAGQIRELMGTVPNAVFEEILEAVSANQSAQVVITSNRLLDAGNSPAQLARQFVRYLRNTLVAKIAGITPDNDATELLQLSPDERRRAARSAMLFTEEDLARFLQVMLRTFDELGYRQEQRFHFELGLIKLVHLQRLIPVEEILSGLPSGGGSARPAPVTAPRAAAALPPTHRASETAAPSHASETRVHQASPAPPAKPSFSPFEADRSRKMSSEPVVSATSHSDTTVGALALAPEPPRPIAVPVAMQEAPAPVITEAPKAAVAPPTTPAAPTPEPALSASEPVQAPSNLEAAQHAVGAALEAQKHTSASHELEESAWTVTGSELRIQTNQGKTLFNMMFNAEAERIIKAALREAGLGALKLTLLQADPAAKAVAKKARAPRTGSVQAKAMEHPLVQQAQKLFHAEIRNVMDLRPKD
ncbi:MAG TPA: DNA polymerase III subunit gamma/tau [Acidobacteriaceae bacterium]